MRCLLVGRVSLCKSRQGFGFSQKCGLVNVKLKWVKDKELDAVVVGEKHVKAVSNLVSLLSSSPDYTLPIFHRGQLGLPPDLKLSSFLRRFPNIFVQRDTRFGLTSEAIDLHREEAHLLELNKGDLLARLCKLLMLTRERTLPLHSIDHLRWDMGLPYDYRHSLLPSHPDLFSLVKLSSDLVGLKLMHWDERLAVSHLQGLRNDDPMAFPVKFTRGFGLKRKSMEWLHEWQRLPYTSPYLDASHLDPRTDLSEKRNVGVFHELLHLTIGKKMERKNVSNLRKPFALPYKFTKVFERHPGIFYISLKCNTQTVILREAYDRRHLLEKHPLVDIRAAFANMVTSRALYQKSLVDDFGTKIIYPEEEESESGSDYPLVVLL